MEIDILIFLKRNIYWLRITNDSLLNDTQSFSKLIINSGYEDNKINKLNLEDKKLVT